jgi:hypothetical protein
MRKDAYLFIVYSDENQPIHTAVRRMTLAGAKGHAKVYLNLLKRAEAVDVYKLHSDRPLRISDQPEFGEGRPW